jgi:hypothetical protein
MAPRAAIRMTARILAPLALLLVATFGGCTTQPDAPESDAPGQRLRCIAPCRVLVDEGQRFEPAVAINPVDPLNIVAASIDTTPDSVTRLNGWWPLVHVSFDGGSNWTTRRMPGGPGTGPSHPFFAYNAMGDPVPVFLPDGTLLISAIADARLSRPQVPESRMGDAVVLWRSHDGGRTFPEASIVKEGGGLEGPSRVLWDEQDKQSFALGSDGTLLLSWVRIEAMSTNQPSPAERVSIVATSSTDGGRTWSDLSTVVVGTRLQGPSPLIRHDGAWLMAWFDQGRPAVLTSMSRDRGATWSPPAALDASTKFPQLAQAPGPEGTRTFLLYPAATDGPESLQVPTLRWSDDGGATWSAPLALDDAAHPGATLPALAADANGTVFATFWHALESGATYHAVAVRDGRIVARTTLGATEGPPGRTGHYLGLAPHPDGGAFAVWNARTGTNYQVTAARLTVE